MATCDRNPQTRAPGQQDHFKGSAVPGWDHGGSVLQEAMSVICPLLPQWTCRAGLNVPYFLTIWETMRSKPGSNSKFNNSQIRSSVWLGVVFCRPWLQSSQGLERPGVLRSCSNKALRAFQGGRFHMATLRHPPLPFCAQLLKKNEFAFLFYFILCGVKEG